MGRGIKTAGVVFACLCLWQQAAAGAEKQGDALDTLLAMGLEELVNLEVSVATGTPKSLKLAPAVASVITRADIDRMAATSLEEVLATVPGLHVGQMFAILTPHYTFRGLHGQLNPHVLFLIDGKPMTWGQYGSRNYSYSPPLAMVSRIEVVRGPGSALYGADAFAGVINVITAKADEIAPFEGGAGYGSFATSDVWARHGGTHHGWDTTFGLEYRHSGLEDDRIIDRDLQTVLDGLRNAPRGLPAASLAPAPVQTDYTYYDAALSLAKGGFSCRLAGQITEDKGVGAGLAPVVDNYGWTDEKMVMADLDYRYLKVQDWDLHAGLRYKYEKQDSIGRMFPPGSLQVLARDGNLASALTPPADRAALVLFTDGLFGQPIYTDHLLHSEVSGLYSGFADHLLRLAAGFSVSSMYTDNYKNFGPGVIDTSLLLPLVDPVNINNPANPINPIDGSLTHLDSDSPYIFMQDQNRTVVHLSLQDEWGFAADWTLTAGVRYDHYSDFGSTVNPRLALVWQTSKALTSKLMYGRAFRAPTFGEQYQKNNPSTLGNPNLDPETIDTVELAFDFRPFDRLQTTLNLFHYQIKDMIDFRQNPGASTISAANARDQDGEGFEIEANWQAFDKLLIKANLAYQRSEDSDTDAIAPDAPELRSCLNPQWQFLPDWYLDGQYHWVGKRHRAATDSRADIADYDLVHFVLRRTNIAGHWEAALKALNLFDEDAREPGPSTIPGDYPLAGRSLWGQLRYSF